ncbi:hypothetical protein BDK51DRAFT_30438 [Blyttiomyces helicus]|uniref:Uncharacterized protein n=1 Tax=Blyttiomyces helicus TaxID=388810 RepID=A0A4P9WKD8_9FUNG|nr:hypothetical protein BDK51DRAFT_30438 [Blyttiomyces helicus]|eukprot:RKO93449.1 hypothetical protein BDK51DRAFT_30438 [Blyttiomyces helicus]
MCPGIRHAEDQDPVKDAKYFMQSTSVLQPLQPPSFLGGNPGCSVAVLDEILNEHVLPVLPLGDLRLCRNLVHNLKPHLVPVWRLLDPAPLGHGPSTSSALWVPDLEAGTTKGYQVLILANSGVGLQFYPYTSEVPVHLISADRIRLHAEK